MQSDWKSVLIEDIAKPEKSSLAMGPFGSDIKSDFFVSDGVPVIRGKNISSDRFLEEDFVFLTEGKADELSNSSVIAHDLVFTHRGTLGQVGIIPEDSKYPRYIVSQSQMKLTVDPKKAYPLFVFYYFKSPQGSYELLKNTSTTGVPAISRPLTSLRNASILLPPLPTQKRIADILGTLDDKIELNRQMNRTLEAMARAIFKSWFVDFDPVYTKMEGRAYPLRAEVMNLFPDELVESELGLIPKGWVVGIVSDFGKVVTGKTPSTKNPDYYSSDDVQFLKIPDMHDHFFVTETTSYLSKMGADSQKNKYIPPKSICVSCIATPGLVVMPSREMQTNQQINSVIPKSELLSSFLLLALKRKGDEIRLRGSGGSVLHNLNKSNFSRIQIITPTVKTLEYYETIIAPIFKRIVNCQKQNDSLVKLRDTLLPKLMNGEIQVGK